MKRKPTLTSSRAAAPAALAKQRSFTSVLPENASTPTATFTIAELPSSRTLRRPRLPRCRRPR
jgi:hypothetical protein